MYKYNLYDNGIIVFQNVKGNVIKNALGIEYSRITDLVKTGGLYKGRYKIERLAAEENARYYEDSMKQKQHAFGEDILREWDEVVMLFRLRAKKR